MYIDGMQVAASTALTYFNKIEIGDCWVNNNPATTYFDDVSVQDTLP